MLFGFETCRVDGTDTIGPLLGSVAFRINETHFYKRSFGSVAVLESLEKWSSETVAGVLRNRSDRLAITFDNEM